MKKIVSIAVVFLMCFGLVGCGGQEPKTPKEVKDILDDNDIEYSTIKYEFKQEPYVYIYFEEDDCFFDIGKESIEDEYYELALDKDGGITYTAKDGKTVNEYAISKDEVALDGKNDKDAKEQLDEMLEQYELTQEELFNFIIDYAKDNLLTETKEDKKTYVELMEDNGYTDYSEDGTLLISDGTYSMMMSFSPTTHAFESGFFTESNDTEIMFSLPYSTTLGTHIIFKSSASTFYDIDEEKVISGNGTITADEHEKGVELGNKCYLTFILLTYHNYRIYIQI